MDNARTTTAPARSPSNASHQSRSSEKPSPCGVLPGSTPVEELRIDLANPLYTAPVNDAAAMAPISIPTASRLPSSLRLDAANPIVQKTLNRLSRSSLLSISLDWLDESNRSLSGPYLLEDVEDEDDEQDDFYPPARSLGELRELYADMQTRKGSKREVLDRILEGDWRQGLTLYQLAMADFQYLYDHPTTQKWSSYRILPLRIPLDGVDAENPPRADKESLTVPRFHPSSFLQNLQAQVLPDVKAHYNFERYRNLPALLLRIFILDSPYNTDLAAASNGGNGLSSTSEASRSVYIAFPDASPHIFISKSHGVGPIATGESRSLQSLIIQGIPKALSRPRERYTLKSTSLSTRNLEELLHRRGSGRNSAAGGGWSIYADEKRKESPLDTILPTPPLSEGESPSVRKPTEQDRKRAASPAAQRDEQAAKRARRVAQARFGNSAKVDDGRGVERVDVVLEDAFPSGHDPSERMASTRSNAEDGDIDAGRRPRRSAGGRRSQVEELLEREQESENWDGLVEREDPLDSWRPNIRLTFHGAHVFAGVRQLVENGVIDGERMPGWMTGEEGVTIGAVRHGRIRGHKGSGI